MSFKCVWWHYMACRDDILTTCLWNVFDDILLTCRPCRDDKMSSKCLWRRVVWQVKMTFIAKCHPDFSTCRRRVGECREDMSFGGVLATWCDADISNIVANYIVLLLLFGMSCLWPLPWPVTGSKPAESSLSDIAWFFSVAASKKSDQNSPKCYLGKKWGCPDTPPFCLNYFSIWPDLAKKWGRASDLTRSNIWDFWAFGRKNELR